MMERKAHRDPPLLIPRELLDRRFACSNCGTSNAVNWYQKQDTSLDAVEGTTAAGGYWVRASFQNNCANCDAPNQVAVNRWNAKSRLVISADEAFREEGDLRIFVFAGCGVQRDFAPLLEERCMAIERDIAHISNGSLTRFHATEIMAVDALLFKKVNIIGRMATAISVNRVSKFGVAFCSKDKASEKSMRDAAASFYMLLIMWIAGQQGIVPKFEFDQTQSGKKNGWLEECFTGLKRYPIFYELAGGNIVPDPVDVKPLSTVHSKASDCIAYITAREIAKAYLGKNSEVPSKRVGMLHSAFFADGDVTYGCQLGFPSKALVQAVS